MSNRNNVLLEKWETPFGIPPFNKIKPEDFTPAINKAIALAKKEIDIIVADDNKPTFENTIEKLEESGKLLNLISATLFNLNSAETNPEIQTATHEASSLLTRFSNDITLNQELFSRVKDVYTSDVRSELDTEQIELLEDKFRGFKNGGAQLKGEKRKEFREITEKLSVLSVQFEENLLAETNAYVLHLKLKEDLGGLPETLIESAAEEALLRNEEGWIFTLQYPGYVPFMQYSDRRDLREKMYFEYASRCFKDNERSNKNLVREIVNLRLGLARLLEFDSYSDYVLEDRMAGSKERVNLFLDELNDASVYFARKDFDRLSEYASKLGHIGDIERWDWAYYSEKLKKDLYSFDDELLKPYFRLAYVEKAIFDLAGDLFGLTFLERENVPSYNNDTRVFEVLSDDKKHIAVLMVDYHPRKGKNGGAWMTAYREQYASSTENIRPIVSIVMNFSKATKNTPSLLSHNELTTLLHEFGHALHGMLSNCRYESISGTNVKRDFVELPSQLMENWAYESEWLDKWAIHYKTSEKIPADLINKIKSSLVFNEGFACNRQLSFGFLDMAWHSLSEHFEGDISDYENKALAGKQLFSHLPGTNQSCAFGHLFSGGYAAAYYGYKWAEVLDADAFSVFKEKGIFNREVANSFKQNILEKGGSDNPMKLYKNFRGSEPKINAFIERSGFKK
jgi:peptidyl-dipeptidase Dcp